MMNSLKYSKILRHLIVPAGKKVSLRKDYDPALKLSKMSKQQAKKKLAESVTLLAEYQDKLYAQDIYGVLIIFQAMDAAGKDGAIKHVMSGLNPQGTQVTSFKAPSTEELNHDYLWRCFKALPERGRIGIFNRSYYEEVLVVRVHPEFLEKEKLPPKPRNKKIWAHRFEEINGFEKYLTNNGIIVLKFFLNVSKEEQKRRFLERIEQPEKNWKLSPADAAERAHWDEYMDAYEDCMRNTSTEHAPWYVIPADDKPLARLIVATVIHHRLKELGLKYPTVSEEQKKRLLEIAALLSREK
ncbi:MAG TPA: polyphosphate kinase 2 family protein [Candidatus Acidoferrales bacterium]|nr:polyphosphate kinase 2 family protein [Candidatus Acidoferrales bacterium]